MSSPFHLILLLSLFIFSFILFQFVLNILPTDSGAYAGFLGGGGAQLSNFWEFRYTCSKAACREQRSSEPLLGRFGGMPPKKNF